MQKCECVVDGVLEDLGIINDDDEDSKSSSYFDYDDEDGYDLWSKVKKYYYGCVQK